LGTKIDREASFRLLDIFVELGGNFINTAKIYMDPMPEFEKSASEKTIGRWLKQRADRDSILVATKGAHPDLATMKIQRLSKAEITHDLEMSLQNLGVQRIALYYVHRDDPSRPVEEIIDTLHGLVKAGKIQYFACSNWRRTRIEAAQAYAKKRNITGFVANQMGFSLKATDASMLFDPNMVIMDDDLQAFHMETQLTAIPYGSQGGGYFQKMARRTKEERLSNPPTNEIDKINARRLCRLETLSAESGISINHLVLGYLLSQPFPVIPIIGCRTPEQLRESCGGADVRLRGEQVRFLEG
jgi:aryl-alcohol dehydrogenase-like predicted oxidoreductase